jgi:ATP-dependent helicase/nuclease subunit A
LTERLKLLQTQEYRRLFYVAATRAESRLYIGGYTGQTRPIEESWYYYAQNALSALAETKEIEMPGHDLPVLHFANPATGAPDKKRNTEKGNKSRHAAPPWLFKPAPEEPYPPRPLVPSRPSGLEGEASLSPLQEREPARFKRGNIIHKLLQILPDIAEERRHHAMCAYLSKPVHRLGTTEQEEIFAEISALLNHPEFAPVFGPDSMAEVPVTGLLPDGILISGQIDRLVIAKNCIYIVDYKTNRPPPARVEDVPAQYKRQMEAYAGAIRSIYPGREIRTALIWTNIGKLMELDVLPAN